MHNNLNKYPKGSEWRKWDLHVHTPASHISQYGGDTPEVWEKFIKDLESLPTEIKVVGINDYLFLDGYKKVVEFKQKGRLNNIDLILPVIEFRLKEFVGHEKLRRLNYHIIFADVSLLVPAQIEAQFLNRLSGFARLDAGASTVSWGGVVTRDSLIDLGRKIRGATPVNKMSSLSNNDFDLGFNNINFEISAVETALGEKGELNTYLSGKYLKAIGKSEWEDFRWEEASIADKKTIINGCDFVFCAASTANQAIASKQKLTDQAVNNRLLHCSDAHSFSTGSSMEQKIGTCFTWIKADPTFEGLKQTLNEPDDRIFIGSIPLSIQRVIDRPTRVVNELEIRKAQSASTQEKWFDQSVELNQELIAVIGNKGSGKSALADILGLLGNTPRYKSFSFLRSDRFRDPKDNKAKQFQAFLTWADGNREDTISLDRDPSPESIEKIKYIPQNYLEEICNEVGLGRGSRFYAELQQVIFSHVLESERLGFATLDELLEHRGKETNQAIDLLEGELKNLNQQIIACEDKISPPYQKTLESKLAEKIRELNAHEQSKPKEVTKPGEDSNTQKQSKVIADALEKSQTKLAEIEKQIVKIREEDSLLAQKRTIAEKLITKIENIKRQISAVLTESKQDFEKLGLDSKNIVSFIVNIEPIHKIISDIDVQRSKLINQLDKDQVDSVEKNRLTLAAEIEQLQSKLSAPQQVYQAYLKKLKEWQEIKEKSMGSAQNVGSMEYFKHQLAELKELPKNLRSLAITRDKKTLEIFKEKQKLQKYYASYYGTVQGFLGSHPLASSERFKLTFNVSMAQSGFANAFLGFINQRKVGPFAGVEEGGVELKAVLDTVNWDSAKGVLRFTRNVLKKMKKYDGKDLEIKDQLKQGVSLQELYDFLFSLIYISPIYRLNWDGKGLEQLSPGERGNLLLIFYLLVDRDDIPIVIDQPEENLDNHTVYKTLVPCIKDAKKRRQIIMVTHNPNLAVVCDADQIICAEIHKDRKNEVHYTSGSIENPGINKKIVDILEGTRPAFDKRDSRYQREHIQIL
jgi:ABC-type lipoprotein export system ATPase subunit